VASKPIKDAKANASAMPAVPAKPPEKIFAGLNEAPKSIGSGPPFARFSARCPINLPVLIG